LPTYVRFADDAVRKMNRRMLPTPFVPDANSDAVHKLQRALDTDQAAAKVHVVSDPNAGERDCYVNVQYQIDKLGGKMQLGWAIWQHSHVFIEAEPHAVFDPGDGKPWVDCTPHVMSGGYSAPEILFIPNDATNDFETTDLPDNVRIPLVDDPRVSKALALFSERTALISRGQDRHFVRHRGKRYILPEGFSGRRKAHAAECGAAQAEIKLAAENWQKKCGGPKALRSRRD
jgi:hypothetical protein